VKDAGVAGRYARALFEAAREKKVDDPVGDILAALVRYLKKDTGAYAALRHPSIPTEAKGKALRAALGAGPAEELLASFLGLVLTKKRLDCLEEMSRSYEALGDEAHRRRRVRVATAHPLTGTQAEGLTRRLSEAFGGPALLEAAVNPDLLGGAVFQAGDHRWDFSLRGNLEALKERLLSEN
jgi:F-type H+-transporting ATPase subunit delta